jgi:RNA 2',3'-cyclic 3'-phosphodiesterase
VLRIGGHRPASPKKLLGLVYREAKQSVRVFIAAAFPADLKAKLAALQQEFRHLPLAAAWVQEAGFHLTLKFLGEVESSLIAPILSCMMDARKGYHPFALTLRGVGVFPRESSPRVLWVGIQDDTGLLKQMQQTLETRLAQIGFPPESRPFAPHLTLARLKRVAPRSEFLAGLKAHREVVLGQFDVDQINLMESQLHPAGARYSVVHAVPFEELRIPPKANE